jgi:hypothetical protein
LAAKNVGPSPALITVTAGRGGSISRENGTSSTTQIAHSVSTDGFPEPLSSWESVDFAMPARRATSVSDRPARWRSRRSEAAMASWGAWDCIRYRLASRRTSDVLK